VKKIGLFLALLLSLALPLQGLAGVAQTFCHSMSASQSMDDHSAHHAHDEDHDQLLETSVHSSGMDQTDVHACSHCGQCCSVAALPLDMDLSQAQVLLDHVWTATMQVLTVANQTFYLERPPRISFV
jgi:hypothetical protein